MSTSSSFPSSSTPNTIESLGNLDVEEYSTWSTDEQIAYVESYLTDNCKTEEEKPAKREAISEEVDALLLKYKTEFKQLENIAGDESTDSQTRITAETLAEALDSVTASLESLTDEVWNEAVARQDLLSVDMSETNAKTISLNDAKDGDTITVNAPSAEVTGSSGIFESNSATESADSSEQKTLTMDMTHVESSECVSYDDATGEMKFHYVMDDGREVNVIIQGSPKIVMTGGSGGLTENQLKTEPWKTASQFVYETPTSEYPLSYYVDGTLPKGSDKADETSTDKATPGKTTPGKFTPGSMKVNPANLKVGQVALSGTALAGIRDRVSADEETDDGAAGV